MQWHPWAKKTFLASMAIRVHFQYIEHTCFIEIKKPAKIKEKIKKIDLKADNKMDGASSSSNKFLCGEIAP